ncbi:MAG: cobalamin-dependent protein [Actinomycetota bacterium]
MVGKVLLVNSNQMKPVVTLLGLDFIGECLRHREYEVDLLDLAFERDFKSAIDEYFQSDSPDVIGVTIRNTDDCYFASQDFIVPKIKRIVDYIRQKTEAPIIFGGAGFSTI